MSTPLLIALIFVVAACLSPIFAGVIRDWSTKQRQRQRREHIDAVLVAQRKAWRHDIRVLGGSGARR